MDGRRPRIEDVEGASAVDVVPSINCLTVSSSLTPTAILVDGQTFYCSRELLAVSSSFFTVLFYGNYIENTTGQYTLKDISPEEFHTLLVYLHNPGKPIENESVEPLLYLSDRFEVPTMTDRVEKALMQTEGISQDDKAQLADQYHLIALQAHLAADSPEAEYCTLTENTELDSDNDESCLFHATITARDFNINMDDFEPRFYNICGLLWFGSLELHHEKEWHPKTEDELKLHLKVNNGRRTASAWSIEGVMNVEMRCDKTDRLIDTKQYNFHLSNDVPTAHLRGFIVRPDSRDVRGMERVIIVNMRFMKRTGLRTCPSNDFSSFSPISPINDVTFLVDDGDRVSASSQILSIFSYNFREILSNEEKGVRLEGVAGTDLRLFLAHCYPNTQATFTAAEMWTLLLLAKRFGCRIEQLHETGSFYYCHIRKSASFGKMSVEGKLMMLDYMMRKDK